jgi:hypothetical protein
LVQRLWSRLMPRVVVLTFSNDNDRDDNTSSLRFRTNYKPYFVQVAEGEWQIRGYPLPPPTRPYASGNPWVEQFALARAAVLAWAGLRYNELIVPDPTEDLVEMLRRTTQAPGRKPIPRVVREGGNTVGARATAGLVAADRAQ